MFTSLRTRLAGIGEPRAGSAVTAIPNGFHSAPKSLRAAMRAMVSPRLSEWIPVPGREFSNEYWTEECQGITTDGHNWYISSNNNDFRSLSKFGPSFELLGTAPYPSTAGQHLGAVCYHAGQIYGAVEGPTRLAKFSTDPAFVEQLELKEKPQEHTAMPWCAFNPWNGWLYSSNFRGDPVLFAYDPAAGFKHVSTLRLGGPPFTGVQGGAFSSNGRLFLAFSDDNFLRAYCALNGQIVDSRQVAVSSGGVDQEEIEGLTVAAMPVSGVIAHLHLIVLDNDLTNRDDVRLLHYLPPATVDP